MVIPFMEGMRNKKLEGKKECQKRRQEKAMNGNKEEAREKGKREWIGRKIQSHDKRNPQVNSDEAQRFGREREPGVGERQEASGSKCKAENPNFFLFLTHWSSFWKSGESLYLHPLLHACMLRRFNHIWLFVIAWTVAHQAPLSMGFSRHEYWNGLSCPPPGASFWLRDQTLLLASPALGGGFQPPHPLSSPSPPAPNPFQHQGLFQWINSSHEVATKYWSFSFSISPSNEHPGLISFRMDWLDLLVVQGTLKSLLKYRSSKASIFRRSAFFTVQLSHPYLTCEP